MDIIRSVRWSNDNRGVCVVDQRALPERFVELDLRTLEQVCEAIRTLAVRGAPAIGITGAMGLVVALDADPAAARDAVLARVDALAATICGTRPTAVNLPWALARMRRRACSTPGTAGAAEISAALREEASAILEEDRVMCLRIGEHGLRLLQDGTRVLTHCNTGALATGGIGTALAPVYLAHERGISVHVYACETRPLLQGSRLTAWELSRAGIPVTVLADSAAASLMRAGQVDLCIVGADRIAANGDVANKVGTYALAIAAQRHGIPFFVAAPTSTFDPDTAGGDEILVEQRSPDELRCGFGRVTVPTGAQIYNPAFDVTPAELITGLITDQGLTVRSPNRPTT